MIQVCDIVEYGLDSFGKKPQTYRVTHHLKVQTWSQYKKSEKSSKDFGVIWTRKWGNKRIAKERKQRRKAGQAWRCRYRLLYCRPEEATHVSLTGICGHQAPISKCKKVGDCLESWGQKRVEEARQDAIGDFWLGNDKNFHCEWYWTNLPAKEA